MDAQRQIAIVVGEPRTSGPQRLAAGGRAARSERMNGRIQAAHSSASPFAHGPFLVIGSSVAARYTGARTFDLLPSGATCVYWADGIPLRSTLARD